MADQTKRDRSRRALERRVTTDKLYAVLLNTDGLKRLATVELGKAQDWQVAVADLTDVQKVVHLAMRYDSVDEQAVRGELLAARRRAYESEISIQLERLGCTQAAGRLSTGPSLTDLFRASDEDARSIVATYNTELASQIQQIAATTPSANRRTYVKHLTAWDTRRAQFKSVQIAQYTDGTARAIALRDFETYNLLEGEAELEPTTADCPVCQGWLERGRIPLAEATRNPPPYHSNCPHVWATYYKNFAQRNCGELWAG